MSFHIVNVFLYLLCAVITNGEKNDDQLNDYTIFLEKYQSSHDVSDKFLSFGLDTSLLRDFENLPIKNEKLINLGYHLKPAYIRIGGTAADCLYFKQTSIKKNSTVNNGQNYFVDAQDISNFTMTSKDFLSLYKFTKKIGSRMMFDLNTLLRNPDGSWNSSNAEEIILFSKGHDLQLDWQMGNEPNSFHHVFNISVSPQQLAKDYCQLRKILDHSGYEDSILVGPEANHIGEENNGNKFVKNFLKKGRHCIDFVTWHQYYLNGHIATKEDFVNSTVFERLPEQINNLKKTIKQSGQNISMWISETSSAYGGGAPEISDRYVAGFLWLDKLGVSAKAGIQVVIRQTLYGGNYTMIGSDLEPNPDWWVAVLFKKLVSSRVLNFFTVSESNDVRLYAHCASKYLKGDSQVVIYGINISEQEKKIMLKNSPKISKVFAYILTSNDFQSREIFLNGKVLKLKKNGNLPYFNPKVVEPSKPIKLPPYSMVFLSISGLYIPACQE